MNYNSKIYANILASLNEARILDEEKLRRLTDSSYIDALKILADYGWGDSANDDIDALVSKETAGLIDFVSENCADDKLKDILLAQFLFNNAKAIYKTKLTGRSDPQTLFGGVKNVMGILEDNYSELPAELADAFVRLDQKREAEALSSREIDRTVTYAMYAYLSRLTKLRFGLKKYIVSEIDMLNLMTLLRCRRLGFDQKTLEDNLITGGKIPDEEISAALELPDEAFASVYADSDYAEVFGDALTESFTDIEVRIDNCLYALTLAGKNIITSNAPFINYFYKHLYELKTVKMILICLKSGETDEIKRRMRDIYE